MRSLLMCKKMYHGNNKNKINQLIFNRFKLIFFFPYTLNFWNKIYFFGNYLITLVVTRCSYERLLDRTKFKLTIDLPF